MKTKCWGSLLKVIHVGKGLIIHLSLLDIVRYSESSSTASVGQEMKETRLTVNTVHHRTAGKAWAVQPPILSTRLLMIVR